MKNLQIKILGIILLATFVLFIAGCETQNITPSSDFGAKKFTGSEDLINFLKARQGNDYYNIGYGGIGRTEVMMKTTSQTSISSDSNAAAPTSGGGSNEFSQTNIQVQGVDEPDLVKNDDKYIYKATNGNITIIDAYPAENAKIISIININGTANEIFVNGNKLVVFGMENYVYYNEPMPLVQSSANLKIAIDSRIMPIYYSPKSFIKVYDISDKNNPVIFNSITYDGDYYDARMIDEYIYVIVNQPINYNNDIIAYPSIIREGKTMSIMPTDIYYFNVYDYSYRLTTVMSLKIDEKSDPTINTFLTGYTQNIFVSKNNIYLTSMKQLSPLEYQEIQRQKMIKPILEIVDSKTAQKIRDTM